MSEDGLSYFMTSTDEMNLAFMIIYYSNIQLEKNRVDVLDV